MDRVTSAPPALPGQVRMPDSLCLSRARFPHSVHLMLTTCMLTRQLRPPLARLYPAFLER